MTLGELRRELALRLGLDATTSDGLVGFWDANLLNNAARDISTLFYIPRKSVVFTKDDIASGPLTLPAEAEEVIRVVAPPERVVPIVEEDDYVADSEGTPPAQRSAGPGMFLVKRTSPLTLEYLTTPWSEPPEAVRVVYKAKYVPMQNENDQPWEGQYAMYHPIIAAKAAMQALLSLDPGEPETAMRFKAAQDDYAVMYQALRQEIDRLMYLDGTSTLSFIRARGRRFT